MPAGRLALCLSFCLSALAAGRPVGADEAPAGWYCAERMRVLEAAAPAAEGALQQLVYRTPAGDTVSSTVVLRRPGERYRAEDEIWELSAGDGAVLLPPAELAGMRRLLGHDLPPSFCLGRGRVVRQGGGLRLHVGSGEDHPLPAGTAARPGEEVIVLAMPDRMEIRSLE